MNRNVERMVRNRNRANRTLDNLRDALLVELVRRASFRATDDSPTSTGPRSRSHVSDPTAAAVIRAEERKIYDPVYDAVQDIARALDDMARLSLQIDEKIRFVTDTKERAKEASIIHCLACLREVAGTSKDRVRSGYCQSCYAAWTRQGRPYRAAFELTRRETQETQGNNKSAEKT